MRRRAKGSMPAGMMNRTESRYGQHLEVLKRAGEIAEYWWEGIKIRLADKTTYSPDFLVMLPDGTLECHEVKGFWRDDARVKIKVAAEHFPFRFIAVTRSKAGAWQLEKFFDGEVEA